MNPSKNCKKVRPAPTKAHHATSEANRLSVNDDQPTRRFAPHAPQLKPPGIARAPRPQSPSAPNVQTASASIRTCRHPRNKSILKELAQAAINASIGGWRLSKNDHDFPARSIKLRSTVSSATFPFREPASPPSNSIQPSLKPSSIRIRGVGFFMPCDTNSDSQLSRGTTSIFTGRPSKRENVAAISLGVTRC